MVLFAPATNTDLPQKQRRYQGRQDDGAAAESKEEEDPLKDATTLYVGNLSFYTTEEQIHELFSKYALPRLYHNIQVSHWHD